jgi:hypothetical protein
MFIVFQTISTVVQNSSKATHSHIITVFDLSNNSEFSKYLQLFIFKLEISKKSSQIHNIPRDNELDQSDTSILD